ncbi:sigma-70 family RNA polymerase sigma factor [bacterium]|nr:sigma-70 family RNA polymerase sigma factor [bacterium]
MTKDNERQLIENILNDETGAFEKLIKQHERLVIHMIYRLINNVDDRQDICQDIFLKIYQALPSFRFDCRLSTWIAKVAYRTGLNFLEKKRAALYEDSSSGHSIDEIPGEYFDPEAIMENRDRQKHMEQAISELDKRYSFPLILYHMEDMSYKEISEIMNLPEGTIKSHLFRARKQLKSVFEHNYAGEQL